MHRKRYFPADLYPYPLHYAALRGNVTRVRDLISIGHNPYEPIQDGETPLHVAIAADQMAVAHLLIEEIQNDFELVKTDVKYKCDVGKLNWSSQSILIASNENQWQNVKQMETSSGKIKNLNKCVKIFFKNAKKDDKVAVLDPEQIESLKLIKLIINLLPNGILAWNNVGLTGRCESLLHLAAYYGKTGLLERLIELGADLTVTDFEKRTPFHAACETSQIQIIETLMNKYLNQFDPTALDENAWHGLHYILYRKNRDSFKIVVEKMIEFRMQNFSETPSEAFNSIFRLENDDLPFTSIWSQLDTVFWEKTIEPYLDCYDYDLTYKWNDVTALMDMIMYKQMKDFYSKAISKNPKLLKISSSNGSTVLHSLVCANDLKLVDFLYREHGPFKELFECDTAFPTLSSLLQQGCVNMIEFVLKNHRSFYAKNLEITINKVIQDYAATNYEQAFEVLLAELPELVESIAMRKAQISKFFFSSSQDFNETYNIILRDSFSIKHRTTSTGEKLANYITSNGQSFLNRAVFENQVDLVQKLLDLNVDIDNLDCDNRHVIHHIQSVDMLHIIINRHPEGSKLIHRKDRNGFTLLHILCPHDIHNKIEIIKELLKLGAKLNETTNDHANVLFYTYDEELFRFFTNGVAIEGYIPVNTNHRDIMGNTSLHRHLSQLNSHISSAMLKENGSFVSFNNKGESYLYYLLRFDENIFDRVFKPILKLNPTKTKAMFEAEYTQSKEKASRLFIEACKQCNMYCIDKFLEMELDFDVQDDNGISALLALMNCQELPYPDIVFKLLHKNVNVNLTNCNGQNALMVLITNFSRAKSKGYDTNMIECIINNELVIDHVDCNGETALHYAFRNGELEIINLLLEHGADYSKVNKNGKKPHEVPPLYISQIFHFL